MELQGTKQEPNDTTCNKFGNDTKTTTTLCSSRQWSAFRNPRIVRVSRSFGGKDRHSKVCTVRGLRDRRIRLSVPTAIQLYDLQERLGLSQPSKVIDWLINSTKEDIDKLPPLQLPQGSFGHFLQQSIMGSSSNDQTLNSNSHLLFDTNLGKDGLGMNNEMGGERSKYWDYLDAASKAKSKEGRWMAMNNNQHFHNNQVSAHNFFPDSPLLSYNQAWDPTLTLAQLGTTHNLLSASSSSSSSTFGALPHLFFCPPPSTSTFFPVTTSYPPYSTLAHDPTQTNTHFHLFTPPSSIHPNPNKLLHE